MLRVVKFALPLLLLLAAPLLLRTREAREQAAATEALVVISPDWPVFCPHRQSLFGQGVPRLLRFLRAPSLGTMARSRACLVCLDVGAVYANVLQVGVLAQFMEDSLDQAAFRPFLEPLVYCRPWSVPLRQITPLRCGRSRRCRSTSPWVPASGVPCRPSDVLENRAAAASIQRLSIRTVESLVSC